MNAWKLKDISKIEYEDIELPKPGNREVVVKIKASGICGSDIPRIFRDGAHKMPLIPGHEFSGIVERLGPDTDESWLGKKVGVFPLIPCMKCEQCRAKHYEMCEDYNYLGSRSNGGYAEYVVAPEWNLVLCGENVSYEQAAMIEPMAVAAHAVRGVDIGSDDSVVVIGSGTIGLFVTMLLIDRGIKKVYLIGNREEQRIQAIKIGLEENHFCNINKNNALEFIANYSDGKMADTVFECVGNNDTICQAIGMAKSSGKICMVGNPQSDISIGKETYWRILRKQLKINGSWNSAFKAYNDARRDDWEYIIYLLENNLIHPEKLITHSISLEELDKGLAIMRDKSEFYTKVMVTL